MDEPVLACAEDSALEQPARGETSPRGGRLVAIAISAGLIAGVASWLAGEALLTAFRPPYQRQEMMGQVIMKASFEDQVRADFKNATLAFAMLGGLLAGSLGLAAGLAGRATARGVKAGLFGLLLGGVLTAGASLVLLPVYFRAEANSQEELSRDLTLPLLVHGGIWAAAGLAGGLALGMGLGGGRSRLLNAGLGGLIGAALGAALYEIIGAILFPAGKTTPPISLDWASRLLARLLVTLLSALLAVVTVSLPDRQRSGEPRSA